MSTPTVNQFLGEISRILRQEDGKQLQAYLLVEPPYSDLYQSMIKELQQSFSLGNEDALEAKCAESIPETRGGDDVGSWSAFNKFMVQYFVFLRDVNTQNLLVTYNLLSELVQMLARLAIGLDKQPQLIAHLTKQSTDEGGARETLPERAANIMRQAFVTCLNDRSGDASGLKDGKPDGKKAGIYKIANLCLKVLFQCRKIRNAEQMFVNIDNQAPPLSAYPRGERVTYLYYLGRFHFACNHFWRAQLSLQTAYDECHKTSLKQRRLILLYLIAASITMGRFPSANLLHRPEATGFAEALLPICDSIRKGDLAGYRRIMDLPSNIYAQWLLHFRVYLQLRNRCEVLVWRSLFRKTFQLTGFIPAADSQKAATLSFQDVLRVEQALLGAEPSTGDQLDADLDGADGDNNSYDSKVPSEMLEIESKASSLVVQGLLNGFLSHRQLKFAITGAKRSTALIAGFPNVYQTISGRHGTDVPGWVRKRAPAGGAFGPGRVVNLSGIARPAGSAPT